METDTHYLHGEPCIFGDWIDTRNPAYCVKQVTRVDLTRSMIFFTADGREHRMVPEEAILLRRACETQDHDRGRYDYLALFDPYGLSDLSDPDRDDGWVSTGKVVESKNIKNIWRCWRREKKTGSSADGVDQEEGNGDLVEEAKAELKRMDAGRIVELRTLIRRLAKALHERRHLDLDRKDWASNKILRYAEIEREKAKDFSSRGEYENAARGSHFSAGMEYVAARLKEEWPASRTPNDQWALGFPGEGADVGADSPAGERAHDDQGLEHGRPGHP